MKHFLLLVGMVLIVSACGIDEESKAKLDKAATHAKQAAKEVGDVVSEQASGAHEKWKEMNANRIEEAPKEDLGFSEKQVDVEDLGRRVKAAKDAFFDESDKQIEQSRQSVDTPKKEG